MQYVLCDLNEKIIEMRSKLSALKNERDPDQKVILDLENRITEYKKAMCILKENM